MENVFNIISLIIIFSITIFFILFFISSIRERKPRASWLSSGITTFSILFILLIINYQLWIVAYIIALIIFKTALLFFLPLNKPTSMKIGDVTKRVDERDSMFAREEYNPGSENYNTYYSNHPEFKKVDDSLRKLPRLLDPGGKYYDPVKSEGIKNTFNLIKDLTTKVDGEVNKVKLEVDPIEITKFIKDLTIQRGGDEVGICELNPIFVYSHVGRGPEEWGSPIKLDHKYAIIFAVEMDYYMVEQAPDIPITEEAARKYYEAANISISLARYIRSLGYPARAHISDSNYQIMLPPLAVDAGLGELSRMGYLISKKFGPRVRLGGVTTDLPLLVDDPIIFGVQDFCRVCKKCADNCPSNAIPFDDKTIVRGVEKWEINVEQCLRYWRLAGTDCGLCMKVCPYSHPPTFVHNIVRKGIEKSAIARKLSIWGDDFFYGRKSKI